MKYKKIGPHLVICGTYPSKGAGELIDGEMGDCNRIACMTADPPYGGISRADWELKKSFDLYMAIAQESKHELLDGGSLFMWGGIGKRNHRDFLRACLAIEEKHTALLWKNWITWGKKRAYGKVDDYLFTREELAWFVYGEKPRVFNIPLLDEKRGYAGFDPKYPAKSEYKRRTNVWTDVIELLRNKTHDAEKPVRLYEILYETHSGPGEAVLDVCAGSGAAGEAAIRTGRKAILVEEVEKDFEMICERMQKVREGAKMINMDSEKPVPVGKRYHLRTESMVNAALLRLVVPEQIAPHFVIHKIEIGRMFMYFNSAPASAMLFSDAPCKSCSDERLRILFPLVRAGEGIELLVENISHQEVRFMATLEATDLSNPGQHDVLVKEAVRAFYDRKRALAPSPIEVARELLNMSERLQDAIALLENADAQWPDDGRRAAKILREMLTCGKGSW